MIEGSSSVFAEKHGEVLVSGLCVYEYLISDITTESLTFVFLCFNIPTSIRFLCTNTPETSVRRRKKRSSFIYIIGRFFFFLSM
jgi:hypothetical protein